MVDDVPGAVKPSFSRESGANVNDGEEILKTGLYYGIYNVQIYEVITDMYNIYNI